MPDKLASMRLVLNIVLLLIAIGLGFALYSSIEEPIAFGDELGRRTDVVVDRLKQVRTAQQLYRDAEGTDGFAKTFDDLTTVLRNGRIPIVSVFGDPDDPNFDGQIRYDTAYKSAYDSIQVLGIDLDSLRYVPFGGGQFEIFADTTRYQQTLVDVVEVSTRYGDFMGPFADARFQRYDQSYDPGKTLKFGNRSTPSLSGNWE